MLGQYRMSGMYGSAWRGTRMLAEAVEVQAPVEIGRIAVPIVGQTREGTKRGRETREGTMNIQKIDTSWEWELYNQVLALSLDQRRAMRDAGTYPDYSFTLILKLDDPEALGMEKWQLTGVRIWRLPLGFNIGDELIQREFPITWESETPLSAFKKVGQSAQYLTNHRPQGTSIGTPTAAIADGVDTVADAIGDFV